MCGIWCRICARDNIIEGGRSTDCVSDNDTAALFQENSTDKLQHEFICRRGPDLQSFQSVDLGTYTAHLSSHVLWTQGKVPVQQPYSSEDGAKLMLFNGDIYSFTGFQQDIDHPPESENDGLKLFQLLERCESNAEDMSNVIAQLQGPFAFIFLDKTHEEIWFVRDFFGRESLLFSYDSDSSSKADNFHKISWNISSASVYKNVCEVPTAGLFRISLRSRELTLFSYSHERTNVSELCRKFVDLLKTSGFITSAKITGKDNVIKTHFSSRLKLLNPDNDDPSSNENILSNIVSEARKNLSAEDFMRDILKPLSPPVKEFLHFMRKSIKRRVSTLPPFCKECMIRRLQNPPTSGSSMSCDHSKVSVLFSGGLDSTVIAYLACESLSSNETIDLINVAFSKTENFSNIPDRKTALASYEMLKESFSSSGVKINLVLVNILKPEVECWRKERIKFLISPLSSVLDDSLGVCLWFAARGKGVLHSTNEQYFSPARIVLLGSGADELLGGYGRHRSAYERYGWEGLHSEMQLEIDRISIRNLGRDNRIVSDHGLCPRMPFLDETLVDWLTTRCDLWVKCCPVNEGPLGNRGSGEKLLLRAVGAYLFGEKYIPIALFPKVAMQFGSRIAKLENSKEKGGDNCQRLL